MGSFPSWRLPLRFIEIVIAHPELYFTSIATNYIINYGLLETVFIIPYANITCTHFIMTEPK